MTTTTTCPAWCNAPHEANVRTMLEQNAEDGIARDVVDGWLAEEWTMHSVTVGDGYLAAIVDFDDHNRPVGVLVPVCHEHLSAAEARIAAANLLAAADKLDAIAATS